MSADTEPRMAKCACGTKHPTQELIDAKDRTLLIDLTQPTDTFWCGCVRGD